MDFSGKGLPLTRIGLTNALQVLDLESSDDAYIWTVIQVETASLTREFGFRLDRQPQLLFERHKFREFTDGRFNKIAPNLSGPPGGYGTFLEQYERLKKAIDLCRNAGIAVDFALESASWGLGQIMGFNFKTAGYSSVTDMTKAMVQSEDNQLMAMCFFLNETGLGAILKKRDWENFAKRYNGKQYWKNHYDLKLAEQYKRFSNGRPISLEMRDAQAALFF